MFTRGRKALALGALVLLVLAAQPATAQQATCTNMVLPTPGTDANVLRSYETFREGR